MNSFRRIVRKVKEKKLQMLQMHLEHSELPFNTYIFFFSLLAPGIIYLLDEITVYMILDIPQSMENYLICICCVYYSSYKSKIYNI